MESSEEFDIFPEDDSYPSSENPPLTKPPAGKSPLLHQGLARYHAVLPEGDSVLSMVLRHEWRGFSQCPPYRRPYQRTWYLCHQVLTALTGSNTLLTTRPVGKHVATTIDRELNDELYLSSQTTATLFRSEATKCSSAYEDAIAKYDDAVQD